MLKSEFGLIDKYFSPLTEGAPGAFGLTDDAALLQSGEYIVTKDMLISGVHFLRNDPLDLVARKLLRVNLSDLAAKGAKPVGYFLGCAWPDTISETDVAQFAEGLSEDQRLFGFSLFGGDTCAHRSRDGVLVLSATFFGAPPRGEMALRSGARHGDDVYVSGTIGDAGLGLKVLKRKGKFPTSDKAPLVHRYQLPTPRISLGGALSNIATATIDVSDGLIADASHIGNASDVRVEIDSSAIPLSAQGTRWRSSHSDEVEAISELSTFGDDYEILFTAPPELRRSVSVAADASRTQVTKIGQVRKGVGAVLLDASGNEIDLSRLGYQHFSD